MEFIDNSIVKNCNSGTTSDNHENMEMESNSKSKTLTLEDTKRKRKLSTDSLENFDDNNDLLTNSCLNPSTTATETVLNDSQSSLPIEQFLNETTGFNVKVINKNDKKLVKINLNNNTNIRSLSNLQTKLPNNNTTPQLNKIKIIKINNGLLSSNNSLNEIDDLPSESDLSNGTILIPKIKINSVITDSNNNITAASKPVAICYKCKICAKLFDSEFLLNRHQETSCSLTELPVVKITLNNDSSQVSLSDSNSIESNQISIKINEPNNETKISNSFNNKRSFICNECGIQVKSQSDLNKHMINIHQNSAMKSQAQYKCSQCDLPFNDLSSKNRHEKEHLGLKQFRCYICSYEFTRASNLRSHLLKVHPTDIDKLVRINKTEDNKLKFEFDIDAINEQNEKYKLKINGNKTNIPSTTNKNNTVIYIKDPNNKNADIQHMVVYVDGKPIFVENPKPKQQTSDSTSVRLNHQLIRFAKSNLKQNDNDNQTTNNDSLSVQNSPIKVSADLPSSASLPSTPVSKPVTKIPYLLAAAAAAASSSNRRNKNSQSNKLISNDCARSSCYLINNNVSTQSISNKFKIKDSPLLLSSKSSSSSSLTNPKLTSLKQDHEYNQLVSLFRQKNEKLYNPLLNKSF